MNEYSFSSSQWGSEARITIEHCDDMLKEREKTIGPNTQRRTRLCYFATQDSHAQGGFLFLKMDKRQSSNSWTCQIFYADSEN